MGQSLYGLAGGDITQGDPVKVSSVGVVTRVSALTDVVAGLATNDAASGDRVTIATGPEIVESRNQGSGTIVPGDILFWKIASSVNGVVRAQELTPPGAESMYYMVGVAMSVAAAGGVVLVRPQCALLIWYIAP